MFQKPMLQDPRSRPIRHFVEVFRESRQIRTALLILLLGPDEHLRYFDFHEELGVEQRHLLGDLLALEVQQRSLLRRDAQRRENGRGGLVLFAGVLLENLDSQCLGHRQIAAANQLLNKLHQGLQQDVVEVGYTATSKHFILKSSHVLV